MCLQKMFSQSHWMGDEFSFHQLVKRGLADGRMSRPVHFFIEPHKHRKLPKWREERQTNSACVTLSTDVEYCFMANPSVIDRVFVQLLVGCGDENEDIRKGIERDLTIVT